MRWFRFFLSKIFFLNLTIILILVISSAYIVGRSLNRLTKQGESIKVPDLEDKDISEAIRILDSLGLKHDISDSSKFYVDYKPKSIINHVPKKNVKVKSDRTIFLVVNKHNFKKVSLPKITDHSLREAKINLKIVGLELGDISYIPHIANNLVLEAKFKGKPIKQGYLLPKYAKIDIVLGKGLDNEEIKMPDLIIMNYPQAMEDIKKYSFNIGLIKFDEEVTDSSAAFVYFQDPKPKELVHRAGLVDLWFTQDEKKLEAKYLRRKKIEDPTNSNLDTLAIDF